VHFVGYVYIFFFDNYLVRDPDWITDLQSAITSRNITKWPGGPDYVTSVTLHILKVETKGGESGKFWSKEKIFVAPN